MELKLEKKPAVCVYDALDREISQPAEHDFILPDYCPDIFRVLRCSITPAVVSSGVGGGRLSLDMNIIIRVIYRSENGTIGCVEHTGQFTRSVDVPADTEAPFVSLSTSVQSSNCRVVDKRRLEVRGNVICRVRIEAGRSARLISGAAGEGVQIRRQPVIFPEKRLTAARRITVIDELELAEGKPSPGAVLHCGVTVTGGDGSRDVRLKVVPGKLVTKGEATVQLLYLPKEQGRQPESMRFTIPFSQVLDIEGLDEGYDVCAEIEPAGFTVTPRQEDSTLECELVLTANICATKYESAELVTDAYSTRYESSCETAPGLARSPGRKVGAGATAKCTLSSPDGSIVQVYGVWCENLSLFSRSGENGDGLVYGKMTFCLLGKLADGTACCCEREAAFEQTVRHEGADEFAGAQVKAAIPECSYTLSDDGTVRAKAELDITLTAAATESAAVLSDIKLDESKPKKTEGRCAAKIVFTEHGGNLWEIAKKYSTEAAAIADENPADSRITIIPVIR
ncbi:MAG: DUF3794 domain-containing protein [Ruminococcus sp.]|nr:DUF3794 domain-containing protein [Ruminococcus sp.]